MANIQINELPLVDTASENDVLILNVNNVVTSAITVTDFNRTNNVFPAPVYFEDGSAITPSISFINDQNTGFFRPGNDQVGITTAGVQRAVFNGNGNFGINVIQPLSRLHLAGDARFEVTTDADVLITSDSTSDEALIATRTNTPLLMGVNSGEKMRIASTGQVLVGTTTNPSSSLLRVGGQLDVDGGLISRGGVNNSMQLKNNSVRFIEFSAKGAVEWGDNDSKGTNGFVLVSSGTQSPPRWTNIETDVSAFDFRQLPNIFDA